MSEPISAVPEGYAPTYIDDATLAQVVTSATRLRGGDTVSDGEAALLLHSLLPIAQELMDRRRAFATLHELTAPNVVRLFPGDSALSAASRSDAPAGPTRPSGEGR